MCASDLTSRWKNFTTIPRIYTSPENTTTPSHARNALWNTMHRKTCPSAVTPSFRRPTSPKANRSTTRPPESKCLHLGVATYVDEFGGVPLFAHVMDGNENGRSGIDEHLGLMVKHLKPKSLLKVSDRGTVSVAHLARIRANGFSCDLLDSVE